MLSFSLAAEFFTAVASAYAFSLFHFYLRSPYCLLKQMQTCA